MSLAVAWLLGSGHTFLSVQDNRWQTSDQQTCDGENVTGKRPKMGYKVENDTHLSYHSDIPALEVCRRRQPTHPRTPTPGRQRYKLFCSGAEGLTHTNLRLMSLLVPVATLLSTPNTLRACEAPHSCFGGVEILDVRPAGSCKYGGTCHTSALSHLLRACCWSVLTPPRLLGFGVGRKACLLYVCLFFVGKAEQALPDAMAGVVSSLVFNPWPCLRQWRGRALL